MTEYCVVVWLPLEAEVWHIGAFLTTFILGMPRYSSFHVICHGELCHDMLYVTT